MNLGAPEGTKDLLPPQAEIANLEERWRNVALWRRLEDAAREIFRRFGYEEIRTPVFEYTALFHKASGETTDIVEKEMFTFGDPEDAKGTYSLRPELTPGTMRALIENGLFEKRPSWKVWYLGPAFRKERPQKGRFRQFTQLGVEAAGASDPLLDAETMIVFAEILEAIGVKGWKLRINSIGCGECRPAYREAVKAAARPLLPSLCGNCNRRFERNVFRILDCKADADKTGGLPKAMDHGCERCRAHLKGVEQALRDAKLEYRVDPRIVRGLDYYTRTVYEFTSPKLGSQDALCGGGRYDTLIRDMSDGKHDVGSVGFAAGVERMLLASGLDGAPSVPDFFAVAVTEAERPAVFRMVTELRRAGLAGDLDYEGRSLKAQMRSANRSGARWALLVGPDELKKDVVTMKDMKGGGERAEPRAGLAAALRGGKA